MGDGLLVESLRFSLSGISLLFHLIEELLLLNRVLSVWIIWAGSRGGQIATSVDSRGGHSVIWCNRHGKILFNLIRILCRSSRLSKSLDSAAHLIHFHSKGLSWGFELADLCAIHGVGRRWTLRILALIERVFVRDLFIRWFLTLLVSLNYGVRIDSWWWEQIRWIKLNKRLLDCLWLWKV